jgi:hypothetical protein
MNSNWKIQTAIYVIFPLNYLRRIKNISGKKKDGFKEFLITLDEKL